MSPFALEPRPQGSWNIQYCRYILSDHFCVVIVVRLMPRSRD